MGAVGWVATALSALIAVSTLVCALLDQASALSRKLAEVIVSFGELRAACSGRREGGDLEEREEPLT
ncbi:hypothetical protein ACIRBX_13125 [Kitasatospora sp. NPDC096147]|uniref:hypothetical protein n=1 Tax=Kitasatospora sp. NPDC096147 TaxID=3364093 RepID=UPI00382320E7